MSESMPCGHEKTTAAMLGQPCPYCVTEGKVESGLVMWRCRVCGWSFTDQQAQVEDDPACGRHSPSGELERIPVTPTADVRELVEAGNALDAAIDENHPWKLGAASANWKDASAKHPTYGEGE